MFQTIVAREPDALMEVGAALRADARADKIDLGVGMYRDGAGVISAMNVVSEAEGRLAALKRGRPYLPADGDPRFASLLLEALLGTPSALAEGRLALFQAPGGTGALRLGMELIKSANSDATVWVGTPTWPNHLPMLDKAGLNVKTYRHYDQATCALDFDSLVAALEIAAAGDLVLLHGCCHNPTGADFSFEQWQRIARLAADRGLIPLIDCAYPGLGEGIEADSAGVRLMLESVPEALVSLSCSKSFGLYGERTGLLVAMTADAASAARVRPQGQVLARLLWSNPPTQGSAIVTTILEDAELRARWADEVKGMQMRLKAVRAKLAAAPIRAFDPSFIARQAGMFALLPLDAEMVKALRPGHGIYMPVTGRMSVAGLNDGNIDRFIAALAAL